MSGQKLQPDCSFDSSPSNQTKSPNHVHQHSAAASHHLTTTPQHQNTKNQIPSPPPSPPPLQASIVVGVRLLDRNTLPHLRHHRRPHFGFILALRIKEGYTISASPSSSAHQLLSRITHDIPSKPVIFTSQEPFTKNSALVFGSRSIQSRRLGLV